jgi:glycosyltransferase involved in cell wall biosynthesis
VADFRDPWTDVFYYVNLKRIRLAVAIDKFLEKSVLTTANAVVTVSPTIAKLLHRKAANNYSVIYNGYDKDDFDKIEPLPDDGKFHILHAGHLAVNQNPVGLWTALKMFTEQNKTFAEKLQLDFYGSIHSRVRQALSDAGLQPFTKFYTYVSHEELVAVIKRAELLFFVVPDCAYAAGILTSKLFDYMGAGRPILGIGPEDGDAAAILFQNHLGNMVNASDRHEILTFLKLLFERQAPPQQTAATTLFTRRELTRSLADLFNRLLQKSTL